MTYGYEDVLGALFLIAVAFIALAIPYRIIKNSGTGIDDDPDSSNPTGDDGDDDDDPDFKVTPLSDETKVFECGHTGPVDFKFAVYGTESMPVHDAEPCPDCAKETLVNYAIRCARCGKGIIPGDSVAVYHVINKGLRLDIAKYSDESHVIGCLTPECCPTGGLFAGYWTPTGFKPAFANNRTQIEETYNSGAPVHIAIGK